MPPKNTRRSKTDNATESSPPGAGAVNPTAATGSKATANGSNKRNAPLSKTNNSQAPAKKQKTEPRQGSRSSARHSTQATVSSHQIFNFLLSSRSLPYCYPEDDLDAKGKTYSGTSPSEFSPFEHLLTASILSKPLSHRLGMRTIRTIFNEPFSLHSADAVVKVGEHRVWEAMEAARTQHRQKTASYIFQMGKTVKGGGGEQEWFKGLKDAEEERAFKDKLKKSVKGMGETGADVFRRRVQGNEGWNGVFPFTDRKAAEALEEMGVDVPSAEDLWHIVESEIQWDDIGDMGFGDHMSKLPTETKQKVGFIIILERALGAKLEGNLEEVLKQAQE